MTAEYDICLVMEGLFLYSAIAGWRSSLELEEFGFKQ